MTTVNPPHSAQPAADAVPLAAILKQFLVFFVPTALLLALAFASYHILNIKRSNTALKARETAKIVLAQKIIRREFRAIISDLDFLAHSRLLQGYLDAPGPKTADLLQKNFLNFSRSKKIYDQIRFLDARGMEKIRINFNRGRPAIAPAPEPLDKSGRFYFESAFDLAEGDMFVSPLDLNSEHGRIETPFKPILRFATPVFDSAGRKQGILQLNYLGGLMLSQLHETVTDDASLEEDIVSYSKAMLLNADGYWLLAPETEDEWGFMFGNNRTFGNKYPDEWQLIGTEGAGQLETPRGLFTFITIYPLQGRHLASNETAAAKTRTYKELENYSWILLSMVDMKRLATISGRETRRAVGIYLALLLISAPANFLLGMVRLQHKTARRTIRDNEEKFRTVSDFTYSWEYWVDPQGNFVYMSPSCERISGYTPQAFADDPTLLLEIVHPEDRHLFAGHLDKMLISNEICEIDFRIILPTGGIRWIGHICQPVYGKDGKYLGRRASNRDISKRIHAEESLKIQAFYDNLTGLPNRNLLYDRLMHSLAMAGRNALKLAVLFLDLDDFKIVNDSFGHEMGDTVLCETASRMRSNVRESDTVARLGGDEFIIMLEDIESTENAVRLAQKLVTAISAPLQLDGREHTLSVSIGISIFPDHAVMGEDLIRKADEAMYQAKQRGKNCCRLASIP